MLNHLYRDRLTKYFVWTLVAIYPTCVLFMKHSFTAAMLVLVLLGSIILYEDKKNGCLADHGYEMLFLKVGLAGIAFSAISLFAGGRLSEISTHELEYFDKLLRFIFFVPFLLVIKRTGMKEGIIWWAVVAAGIFSGFYAVTEKIIHPEMTRVSGGGNPINFGCFSLVAAFMSLNGIMFFRERNKFLVIFPLAAFFLGMTGAGLSGSRGAWLAIPIMTIITAVNFRKYFRPAFIVSAVVALLVAAFFISWSVDRSVIQKRLFETGEAVKKYFYGLDDLNTSGDGAFISIGGRLEMYRVSLEMISSNPILGVGPGRYHAKTMELIEEGRADRAISIYQYPHNDYLTVATCTGLPGLVFFLITAYFLPLYILYVYSGKDASNSMLWAGVILVAGYMVFSVSNSTMFKNVRLHYYYILLAATAVSLRYSASKKNAEAK